jgi:lipopolysaccharide/colanic/teichoic acid biosynthesis glycosyltransferase
LIATPPKLRLVSRRKPHESIAGWPGAVKRGLDITLSAAALAALAPLLLLIAAAVKLSDSGPVLYRQVRVGLDGKEFTIIKFRSMLANAEEHLGAVWSLPNDPRCTGLGSLLRRLGLDELPPLWNVLRGEMSLVGPRPERPEFIREFRQEYRLYGLRHTVRCGLTGYAQIHGWRGYTSVAERLRHDLFYVNNWSLLLDIKILAGTLVHGWSERTRQGVR